MRSEVKVDLIGVEMAGAATIGESGNGLAKPRPDEGRTVRNSSKTSLGLVCVPLILGAVQAAGQITINPAQSSGAANGLAGAREGNQSTCPNNANCCGETQSIDPSAQTSTADVDFTSNGLSAMSRGAAMTNLTKYPDQRSFSVAINGTASSSFTLCSGAPCGATSTCSSSVAGANIVFSVAAVRRATVRLDVTGVTISETPSSVADAYVVIQLQLPGYSGYSQVFYSSSGSISFEVDICGDVTNASLLVEGNALGALNWGTQQPVSQASAHYATSVTISMSECIADWDCDGVVDADDFFAYLDCYVLGSSCDADLTGSSDPNDATYGIPDNDVDIDDFFYFLDRFTEGCE